MKYKILIFAISILFISLFSDFNISERPNILFIIADDAGADMSAYGNSWINSPAFDAVAKEGILFEKAYTPNAKCAPSRACLMTGRNPWQLDAGVNHNIYFPPNFKSYHEVLRASGYKIGYTGKGYSPGLALNEDGTNREILGKSFSDIKLTPPSINFSRNDYASNFERFLNSNENSPWCFWVGFFEPHRSYEHGIGLKNGKTKSLINRVPSYLPDVDSVRNDLLDYAIGIEYTDSHIKKMLDILREKGQLDNTLVIITSDHGMPFPRVKGNQYNHSNKVPLAIMWKNGIPQKNRRISDYVSLIDIAPTILELAGITNQTSGMFPLTGKSLVPIFKSSKSGQIETERNYLLVGQERHDIGRPKDVGYPIRGIHKNNFLYLKNYEPSRWPACNPETGYLNCDGSPTKTFILNQRRNNKKNNYHWNLCFGKRPEEELYNIETDPDCVFNLAQNPHYQMIKKNMMNEMEMKLLQEGDLRQKGYGYIYESYPLSNDTNGYYERFMKGEKIPTNWINESDFEKEKIQN